MQRAARFFSDLDRTLVKEEVGVRSRFEQLAADAVSAVPENGRLRRLAEQRLGKAARKRFLADTRRSAEKISMRNALRLERGEIGQRPARSDDVEGTLDADHGAASIRCHATFATSSAGSVPSRTAMRGSRLASAR